MRRTRSRREERSAPRRGSKPRSESRSRNRPDVTLQRTLGNQGVQRLHEQDRPENAGGRVSPGPVRTATGSLGAAGLREAMLAPDQVGIGQRETTPPAGASTTTGEPEVAPESAVRRAREAVSTATDEASVEAQRPPCDIEHETTVHAPDGTPDTRTTIGVCETIRFAGPGRRLDWTTDAGWPRARDDRSEFVWAAPQRPGTQTITATEPDTGEECRIDMTVVAPDDIRMQRQSVLGWYSAGNAGAGMRTDVQVSPRHVNFGWVQIKEDPGPASNVTGYFATMQAGGADLSHHPHPDFVRLGWNNDYCCDTAATAPGILDKPWTDGTFAWRIPMRYRCPNTTGNGRVFTHTLQTFSIDSAGTVTVSKAGASVTRSP